jgi:hypothetical protein
VNLKKPSPHFLANAKRRLYFFVKSNFTLVNLKTPSPHFLAKAKHRLYFFVKSNFILVNLKTSSPHFLAKATCELHFQSKKFTIVNLKTLFALIGKGNMYSFFKSKIHLSEFENVIRSFWRRQHVDFIFEVKVNLKTLFTLFGEGNM